MLGILYFMAVKSYSDSYLLFLANQLSTYDVNDPVVKAVHSL